MTDDRPPRAELPAKAGDGDFLRGVAEAVPQLPMEADVIRLIGAVLSEASDESRMPHRYMDVEAMGEMLDPTPTNEAPQLPPKAA